VQTYTIHEPPNAPSDRLDRAEELVFVKDGFSWLTAIFPPLGFAQARMWLEVAGYLAGISALSWLLNAAGTPPMWISLIISGLNVYLAFEISSLQRWALDRKGWTAVGTVTGKTLDECERRFFDTWLPGQPVLQTERQAAAASVPAAMTAAASPARSLWPFPRKA
jgi:hypothetical protein